MNTFTSLAQPSERLDQIGFLREHPTLKPYFKFYALLQTERILEKRPIVQLEDLELYTLADIQMNLGHFSQFVATYRQLAKRAPNSNVIQQNLKFYEETFNFDNSDWVLKR